MVPQEGELNFIHCFQYADDMPKYLYFTNTPCYLARIKINKDFHIVSKMASQCRENESSSFWKEWDAIKTDPNFL